MEPAILREIFLPDEGFQNNATKTGVLVALSIRKKHWELRKVGDKGCLAHMVQGPY